MFKLKNTNSFHAFVVAMLIGHGIATYFFNVAFGPHIAVIAIFNLGIFIPMSVIIGKIVSTLTPKVVRYFVTPEQQLHFAAERDANKSAKSIYDFETLICNTVGKDFKPKPVYQEIYEREYIRLYELYKPIYFGRAVYGYDYDYDIGTDSDIEQNSTYQEDGLMVDLSADRMGQVTNSGYHTNENGHLEYSNPSDNF